MAVTLEEVNAKFERVATLAELNKKSLDKMREELLCRYENLDTAILGVKGELKGISKSNEMISEDYFYESLNESRAFAGIHFDDVQRNIKGKVKLKDGTTLVDEYDTVMYNDTAICIVEVKYRVRESDVEEIANRSATNFKKLFPYYANYKIYLAVGGLTVEKTAVESAKRHGIGVLRLRGDAVEAYDKNLKIY